MIEEKIVKKIVNSWYIDQERTDGKKEEPPNLKIIKKLLETAFIGSVKKEESTKISFSLTFLPSSNLDDESKVVTSKSIISRFRENINLTVSNISKLSPAFDSKNSTFLIEKNNQDKYIIWGVMVYENTSNFFNEIPVSNQYKILGPPDTLIFRVENPGIITVLRGTSVIGHFDFGEFNPAIPTPFTSEALGKYLIKSIKEQKEFKLYSYIYWHYYRRILAHLNRIVSKNGHGGTVVLIPQEKVTASKQYFEPRYSFNGELKILKLTNELLKEDSKDSKDKFMEIHINLRKQLSERIEILGNLAGIDGALIIDNRFKVITYGATLKGQNLSNNIYIGPDGFSGGGEKFPIDKFGTRHNSAAKFTNSILGAVSFVFSEDGPIRAFTRNENQLLCWPDCRKSKMDRY